MKGPVVVTGGAGFLGSAVRRRAAARGQCPVALIRASEVDQLEADAAYRVVEWQDPDELESCLRDLAPGGVVHCAGATTRGIETVAGIYDANVGLTARLLEAVAGACPGAGVVLLSSAAVYGPLAGIPTTESAPVDPRSHYAASKVMTELLAKVFAQRSGLRCSVARPFNVFGPGEPTGSVVSDLQRQILAEPLGSVARVTLREVVSVRDFVDVDDVADALLDLAERGEGGEVYNIASGIGTSIARLAETAAQVWGRNVDVTVSQPEALMTVSIGDAARLRGLGWVPRHTLSDSLERVAGIAEAMRR